MTPPTSTPTLDLGTWAWTCGPAAITRLAGNAAFARALAAEFTTMGDPEVAYDLENLAAELDDLCAQCKIHRL